MTHIIAGYMICAEEFTQGKQKVYINNVANCCMTPIFRTKEGAEQILRIGCKTENGMIVKRVWIVDPGDTNAK